MNVTIHITLILMIKITNLNLVIMYKNTFAKGYTPNWFEE